MTLDKGGIHEPKSGYSAPLRLICASLVLPAVGREAGSAALDFGKASDAYGFRETFDIDEGQKDSSYDLTLIESNAPGNVFHPGEETVFTFQLGNLTKQALKIEGKVEVIRYGGRARPPNSADPPAIVAAPLFVVSVIVGRQIWRRELAISGDPCPP